MQQLPRPVGVCTLPDASTRTVYQDADGRRLVLDDDNQPFYGGRVCRPAPTPRQLATAGRA